ncbi:MAG: putative type secretion system protein, partial [Frankiales bacterium]|nr:putative type secretion system protein [Frankiales bacterium]
MATALSIVEDEVRELVRRRSLDPVLQPEATQRLVDDVVAEYLDRALISSLPPLGDPVSASRAVFDQVAGFGPLQRYF